MVIRMVIGHYLGQKTKHTQFWSILVQKWTKIGPPEPSCNHKILSVGWFQGHSNQIHLICSLGWTLYINYGQKPSITQIWPFQTPILGQIWPFPSSCALLKFGQKAYFNFPLTSNIKIYFISS